MFHCIDRNNCTIDASVKNFDNSCNYTVPVITPTTVALELDNISPTLV